VPSDGARIGFGPSYVILRLTRRSRQWNFLRLSLLLEYNGEMNDVDTLDLCRCGWSGVRAAS
jgi:hypothetical protein